MHTKAPIYLVFLLSTLVSCTVFIDDQDKNPSILWDGPWHTYTGYGSSDLAWKGTLSLGNQSGSTVAFSFVGTSIKVFGPLWPNEIVTAWSRYVIDDGRPTEFLLPRSGLQTATRIQLYDSGMLPEGEHTLKVTNLGPFLWLDYFELDGDVASSSAGSGTSRLTTTTARPSSTTTTVRPSPATIITVSPSRSTTSESGAPSSQISDPGSTGTSSSVSSSSSAAASPSPSYSIPLSESSTSASSTSSSPNASPPPQDSTTPTPQAHAHGLPRATRVGLITAATAGGVALLALTLLYLGRRHLRRRTRSSPSSLSSQVQKPAPSEGDSDPHATNAHASTLYSAMPSPTTATAPPVVRPASTSVDQAAGRDIVRSCHACECERRPVQMGPRRATDGGVSIAGGPVLSSNASGDAPSISVASSEGEKDMLPPSYQGYAPLP